MSKDDLIIFLSCVIILQTTPTLLRVYGECRDIWVKFRAESK